MRPIKYLLASLMCYEFELFFVLIPSLVISSIVLGRIDRCMFNADSSFTDSLQTLFDVSVDSARTDLFEGYFNIFHCAQIYCAFDWLQNFIMMNGGYLWLAKNGEVLDVEVITAFRMIKLRMCTRDRTVSHIVFNIICAKVMFFC